VGHQRKVLQRPGPQAAGGKKRDTLRAYASQLQFGWTSEFGKACTAEEYVTAAKQAVAEGYDAIKIDFLTFDRTAGASRRKTPPGC